MNERVTKIYHTRDKLTFIGEVIHGQNLAPLMLCSLLPSCDGLITVLEAWKERELGATFIRS